VENGFSDDQIESIGTVTAVFAQVMQQQRPIQMVHQRASGAASKPFSFGLTVFEPEPLKRFQFIGKLVGLPPVAPGSSGTDYAALQAVQFDVGDGGVVGIEHRFKIFNLVDHTGGEPGRERVFPHVELFPCGQQPVFQFLGKREAQLFGLFVHLRSFGGHRTVNVNDEFRERVDFFHFVNEVYFSIYLAQGLLFVGGRPAQYEGILRDDAEFFQPFRKLQDLFAGLFATLTYELKQIVAARFGTEKDYFATGFTYQMKASVALAVERVDARFAPPSDAVTFDQACKFHSSFFRNKKIVVVELVGVAPKIFLQIKDVFEYFFGRLAVPAGLVNGYYRTKGTFERTTETAVVSYGSLAQVASAEITGQRIKPMELFVGQLRQAVVF